MRLFVCLIMFLFAKHPVALTNVDITRGNISAVPIAIAGFENENNKSVATKVKAVIINDLESTGLFRIIPDDAYIEEIKDLNEFPDFASWRQINTSSLIVGNIEKTDDNKFRISFKMWNVFSQKETQGKSFTGSEKSLRRISHKIADEIYKRLTGEEGYFDTKIAYISVHGDRMARQKSRRLALMDQDGANTSYLTGGKHIVLTPRFSPDGKSLLYLSYRNKLKPQIYIMDITNRTTQVVGEFPGMSYAPRYTSNGKTALFSMEKRGVSNIHMLNIRSMDVSQLTKCVSICVSPSASPDLKKIVFNSDMGGSRQLYTMDFDGSDIKRISFGEGSYSSPVWSPRGDLIVFTKMIPGMGFHIGIMKSDGSGERILTTGWLAEGPSWSPNGRVIIFEKQTSYSDDPKIYTIDITGNNEKVLNTEFGATDASWSNLLN